MLDLSEAELDVLCPELPGVVACFGDHLRGHVDADDLTGGTHPLGGEETIEAPTRPQIEHRLSRFEAGDRLRIATAEPHVRALGHRAEIVLGVAELQARVGRGSTAPRSASG